MAKAERNCPAMPNHPSADKSQLRRFLTMPSELFEVLPRRLYSAKMATMRLPFFRSFLINETETARKILNADASLYPKATAIYRPISDLLGNGIFISNGDLWKSQRAIINPAFEGGRLKKAFPHFLDASALLVDDFAVLADGTPKDVEFACSHFAADLIFRTMFSINIDSTLAQSIFSSFKSYQRTLPVWKTATLFRSPSWFPRKGKKEAHHHAAIIREGFTRMLNERLEAMTKGDVPDDFTTKLIRIQKEARGETETEELVDAIAIFLLAGHETSASALAWALYLLAFDQDVQAQLYDEVQGVDFATITIADVQKLKLVRNVFHETLRLYAPVPMMIRETTREEEFRGHKAKKGDLCIISPWFMGRNERVWDEPHAFKPERWNELPAHCRDAFIPFSAGPRVCSGAGFALIEGIIGIGRLVQNYQFHLGDEAPVPVAHLTTRSKDGIALKIEKREVAH